MGGFAACCGLLTWDLNAHFGEGLDMGPFFSFWVLCLRLFFEKHTMEVNECS